MTEDAEDADEAARERRWLARLAFNRWYVTYVLGLGPGALDRRRW